MWWDEGKSLLDVQIEKIIFSRKKYWRVESLKESQKTKNVFSGVGASRLKRGELGEA